MPSNIIRDFKMVKNKAAAETEVKEEKTAEAPRKNYAGLAVRAFVWVIFLLVLLGLWLNPEVIYNSTQYFKAQQAPAEQTVSEQPSIKQLQGQIRELKNSVMNLGAAIGKYNRSDAVDTAMLDKLNEIAEKRLQIIEKGSLQVIKDIETFYDDLSTKIQEDNDRYNTEKLPELLSIIEQYEEGTPGHKLYMKRIEEDMALKARHYIMQLEAVSKRQTQIIDGFLTSKERIIEQTGQITAGMLEMVQKQMLVFDENRAGQEVKALPNAEKLALEEKAEQ